MTPTRSRFHCKMCGYKWTGRPRGNQPANHIPNKCAKCKSMLWRTGGRKLHKTAKRLITKHQKSLDILQQAEVRDTLDYEDATNQGGQEWPRCMYFDDTQAVVETCCEPGYNVATIEVPLGVVDVSWREQPYRLWQTRPAAHPSERGCYMTMPLVLCSFHVRVLMSRVIEQVGERHHVGA